MAAGLLLMTMVYGIINNCFSIYIIPVTRDLGISRQAFSFCQTIIFLGCMTVTALIGKLTKRMGILTIMRAASLVLGIAYLSFAFCSHIIWFYLLSLLVGAGQGFLTMVPLSILVNNWFQNNRGFAMGVICMGSGIGGMIFNPVTNDLTQRFGWRAGFFFLGLGILIVSSVIVFFLLKEEPDGKTAEQPEGMERLGELEREGGSVLRTSTYRILIVLLLFSSLSSYTLVNYIAPYLQDIGYSSDTAALMVSAAMGVMAAGKVSLGILFDRLGSLRTTLLAVSGSAVGLFALTNAGTPAILTLVYLGIFLGCPLGTVAPSILTRRFFGNQNYSKTLGIAAAAVNLGTALSPVIANAVYGQAKSYVPAYWMMFVLALLCLPLSVHMFREHAIMEKEGIRGSQAQAK